MDTLQPAAIDVIVIGRASDETAVLVDKLRQSSSCKVSWYRRAEDAHERQLALASAQTAHVMLVVPSSPSREQDSPNRVFEEQMIRTAAERDPLLPIVVLLNDSKHIGTPYLNEALGHLSHVVMGEQDETGGAADLFGHRLIIAPRDPSSLVPVFKKVAQAPSRMGV